MSVGTPLTEEQQAMEALASFGETEFETLVRLLGLLQAPRIDERTKLEVMKYGWRDDSIKLNA